MTRVTVRWNPDALAELAQLWNTSQERARISAAANAIDQLLRVDPTQKGLPHALAMLDEADIELLLERTDYLPVDLRWLRSGPLEVLFTPKEEDRMVIVHHVRLSG
jgi:hypothetical protein